MVSSTSRCGEITEVSPSDTVFERSLRFLIIVDAENIIDTFRGAGIPFDPKTIRDQAAKFGTIAFAYAFANINALDQTILESIHLAGFEITHCPRLRLPVGGSKDTTDERIRDAIHRFFEYTEIDGVILVTDDRNFAPVMHTIIDRGKRLIRLSLRREAALDQIGEVIHLPFGDEASSTHDNQTWNPAPFIANLRVLPRDADGAQRTRLERMRLESPVPYRTLSTIIIRFPAPQHRPSFASLLNSALQSVPSNYRANVTRAQLQEFIGTLIDINVFTRVVTTDEDDREVTRYEPNWSHSFCAALSSKRSTPESSGDTPLAIPIDDASIREDRASNIVLHQPHRTITVERRPEWPVVPETGLRRFYVATDSDVSGGNEWVPYAGMYSTRVYSVLAADKDAACIIVKAYCRRTAGISDQYVAFECLEGIENDDCSGQIGEKYCRVMDDEDFELIGLVVSSAS